MLGYVGHFLSQYLLNLTSSYCKVGLLCGRFCTSKYCLQLAQLSTGYCLMRYPAMYITIFCFSIDAAGIAAIAGSIADLLSDGSFTFFALLSHLKYLVKFYPHHFHNLQKCYGQTACQQLPAWNHLKIVEDLGCPWTHPFSLGLRKDFQDNLDSVDSLIGIWSQYYANLSQRSKEWKMGTTFTEGIFVFMTAIQTSTIESIKKLIKCFYKFCCCTSFIR